MNKEEIGILELYQDKNFFDNAFKNVSKEEFKIKLYKSYMKQLDLKKELDIANKKIEELKTKYKKEDIPKCDKTIKEIIKEVGYETYVMILMAIEDNIDFHEANIDIYKRAYERYMQLDDVSLLSKEIKQIIEEERGI